MSTPPAVSTTTIHVGVRLPDGRVDPHGPADTAVVGATLTGREWARLRAEALHGVVVERTVTVTTVVGRWEVAT